MTQNEFMKLLDRLWPEENPAVEGDTWWLTLEALLGMRRAGADLIITYAAKDVCGWLKG